jgi:transposase InsO family protein
MSTILPELREELQRIAADPALFCKGFFDLRPTRYQTTFLRDTSKRIVLRWSRQSGKSTFLAVRALYQAICHQKTLTIIIGPSLRQSMIARDKIEHTSPR